MIVLDAGVLIAFLDPADAHHRTAVAILDREADDDLAAPTLTLAEVLVRPARAGRLADAVAALRALDVVEQPLPHDAPLELAHLRARTGLKMPDCCVLLATRSAEARLASFDHRLVRAARGLGIATLSR